MIDYNKRLVEVDEILNHLSEENLQKIPDDVKQLIKENKDKDYVWKYDETKELKDQNLSRDTIVFLSYINMEYLLNEKQKEYMQKLHELNERKLEEEKANQYSADDLFKKSNLKEEKKQYEEQTKQYALVVYKESFFKKMINRIKSLFTKK